MKLPSADHPITIEPAPGRVVVTFAGREVANSTHALTLKESSYRPVHYIPREDIDMRLLARTAHTTTCPYKGEASYFTITVDGQSAANAGWSYETPFDAVALIKDRIAFYPDRVDRIEQRPA